MAQECPHCGLLSPPSAQRCDCGYDFQRHRMEQSYSAAPKFVRAEANAIVLKVAAGLGVFQGIFNLAFAAIGGPSEFKPQDQFEGTIGIVLMIAQGLMMVVFAIATYKGKLYGAYGLAAIGILYVVLSLSTPGRPGWIIPPLIYLGAVVSLHRARPSP